MTSYRVIAGDDVFEHGFDGEPQQGLTFEHEGHVYKVLAHDDGDDGPTVTAEQA